MDKKFELELRFSNQAKLILEKTSIDEKDFIEWYRQRFIIGTSYVIEYLEHKKSVEDKQNGDGQ